jgi:hypothetical protein
MKKIVREQIKKLKKLDIILVEWVDAEEDRSTGWTDVDSMIPSRGNFVTAQTVGFYAGHSRTLLRTFANYDPSNNMGTGRDDIPLINIKEIKIMAVGADRC